MPAAPRILFVAPGGEDYLADSLLHGLRTVLGDGVTDWPRADRLYPDLPDDERGRLYGHGFTMYSTALADIDPALRGDVPGRAARGEYDLIIIGSVWRSWREWRALRNCASLVLIDGGDYPRIFPVSVSLLARNPLRLAYLPRPRQGDRVFKRELEQTRKGVEPIAFSIPEEHVIDALPAKQQLLGSHVVDPEVAALMGGSLSYAFDDQQAYYADLQRSRFGITVKRAGWDAMRHYEIAANGAVPCFRGLEALPPTCAPHGLRDGVNCVSYTSADELRARLESMSDDEYDKLQTNSLAWAAANTTRRRAEQLLETLG